MWLEVKAASRVVVMVSTIEIGIGIIIGISLVALDILTHKFTVLIQYGFFRYSVGDSSTLEQWNYTASEN